MQIGKTLYVKTREGWRKWLEKNHSKEKEIWLIFYKKSANKQRISYNDAVEEALCFGWIDSIVKGINEEKFVQRFSPRKSKSNWSALNMERMKRLIKSRKMTQAGLKYFKKLDSSFKIPLDIAKELMEDKTTWLNFQKFPDSYKRIRIGWIDGARKRPEEFQKRLKYFLNMTTQNKMFGMVK